MDHEPTPLETARAELDTLHTIFGAMKNGQIRAIDWPQAKATLDYLEAKIAEAQERHDALWVPGNPQVDPPAVDEDAN